MAGYVLEGSLGFNPVTEPKIFEEYLVDADQAAEINKNEPVYVMSTGEIAAWTPTIGGTGIYPVGVAMEYAGIAPGVKRITVCTDPDQVYEIVLNGAFTQDHLDDEWFQPIMSDNGSGQSTAVLDEAPSDDGADSTYIARIIGWSRKVGNVSGTTNFVRCRIHTLEHSRGIAAPAPS